VEPVFRRLMSSRPLAVLVAMLALTVAVRPAGAKPLDVPRFAKELATRLRAPMAETHASDFRNDTLGCIAFTTRDMRHLGYRGHALVCEEAYTNRVLGALMDSKGRVRCTVDGSALDDGCYDLVICGYFEAICL
jgi:hypothetical protein